ncbi:unnamed protein product [Enterobius vermicularis]|uniref:Non-specific serine/threonine protein kinase n=1 Tax=Enterobius vermicularis TaxID=51028 RepID=A0A158QA28_ENTVE|nr:unnamed protein product [Enterobius vermicularis]
MPISSIKCCLKLPLAKKRSSRKLNRYSKQSRSLKLRGVKSSPADLEELYGLYTEGHQDITSEDLRQLRKREESAFLKELKEGITKIADGSFSVWADDFTQFVNKEWFAIENNIIRNKGMLNKAKALLAQCKTSYAENLKRTLTEHGAKDCAMTLEELYAQSTIGRQFTAEQLNQWQKQKKHDTVALFETEIRKIAAGSSAKWAQDLNKFTENLACYGIQRTVADLEQLYRMSFNSGTTISEVKRRLQNEKIKAQNQLNSVIGKIAKGLPAVWMREFEKFAEDLTLRGVIYTSASLENLYEVKSKTVLSNYELKSLSDQKKSEAVNTFKKALKEIAGGSPVPWVKDLEKNIDVMRLYMQLFLGYTDTANKNFQRSIVFQNLAEHGLKRSWANLEELYKLRHQRRGFTLRDLGKQETDEAVLALKREIEPITCGSSENWVRDLRQSIEVVYEEIETFEQKNAENLQRVSSLLDSCTNFYVNQVRQGLNDLNIKVSLADLEQLYNLRYDCYEGYPCNALNQLHGQKRQEAISKLTEKITAVASGSTTLWISDLERRISNEYQQMNSTLQRNANNLRDVENLLTNCAFFYTNQMHQHLKGGINFDVLRDLDEQKELEAVEKFNREVGNIEAHDDVSLAYLDGLRDQVSSKALRMLSNKLIEIGCGSSTNVWTEDLKRTERGWWNGNDVDLNMIYRRASTQPKVITTTHRRRDPSPDCTLL